MNFVISPEVLKHLGPSLLGRLKRDLVKRGFKRLAVCTSIYEVDFYVELEL